MQRQNLVFMFDSGYLAPFRTLIYSMRGYLKRKSPRIVIYTNDRKVMADKFVQNVASQIIVIDDKDIAQFRSIPAENIRPALRTEFIAKYTFLKFMTFSGIGPNRFLFMDADMVAIDPDLDLDFIGNDADFAAAPTVGGTRLGLPDGFKYVNHHDVMIQRRSLESILSLDGPFDRAKRFNSGVMFVGEKLVSSEAVPKMVSIAAEEGYDLEQMATRQYVLSIPDLRLQSIPLWYNFTYMPMHAIGRAGYDQFRDQIKIVHFNRAKPWKVEKGKDWVLDIWHEIEEQGREWVRSRSL